MTLQELAAIGETVSGIGVIASLLYLAVQIRQSSRIAKNATTQALLGTSVQMNTAAAGDVSPIIIKLTARESLTHEEEYRYHSFMLAVFAQSWQAYHQHSHGMLEREVFEAYERRTLSYLAFPKVREFWRSNEFRFGRSFQQYVNGLMQRAAQ